jgi:orotate phosphoribosyltransferase
MKEQEVLRILGKVGAVIKDSHIVYTSGKHGNAYVNKDAVYPYYYETSDLCRAIAENFADDNVEVVIGPAIGGVILSQWTAAHLTQITGHTVLGVYAEREEQLLLDSQGNDKSFVVIDKVIRIWGGQQLVIKKTEFVIKRGYDKLIAGKRVLMVEDVLTTGGSAKKVIEATRALGGNVIGLGVLCNRGGVTAENVGNPPKLFSLLNLKLDDWDEADCPLCAQGVPINTDVGKGREYLARKGGKS